MTRRFRRRRDEGGASLVEFALILPIFMMLVLGMFTGGLAYNRKISMDNAVREGARYGATLEDADTVDKTDWSTAVRNRVVELASGDLTNSQVCVLLRKVGTVPAVDATPASCPAGVGAEPTNPPGAQAGDCIAKVWSTRTSKLEAMVWNWDLSLNADGRARYERTC